MYYLKCLLKSESSRDYIDGLLSMKHIANVVVIDMTHIIAKYALISRKEDVQKYGYNEKGTLFESCSGRLADPDEQENVKNAKENNLELSLPWILRNRKLSDNNGYQSHLPITNSDVHLCLFDRFHENNTSSETESLRKIGCVLEFKGMFHSQVEEQLHLQLDSNKNFLNMMTPPSHIHLFRSMLDHHNIDKNKRVINLLQQKARFKLIFDRFGMLQFGTYSHHKLPFHFTMSTLFQGEAEDRLIQNEPLDIEDSLSEALSDSPIDDNANAHQYDDCQPNTKKMKRSSEREQLNCFENCSKSCH